MPSLTSNDKVGKAPADKTAKQPHGKAAFRGRGIEDSSNPQGGPKNKMSVGMATALHGKAVGGHPTIRASEFTGKGRGFATKC